MYQHTRLTSNRFSFFQKFKNFDYILFICILLLGFISLATMYSTDGGEVQFHTRSHFTKLIVFTIMMIVISFINIKYWFSVGYLSYIAVIGLLIWTYMFGITSSGSQRWIDLYFINLQPSELMKIFIILCLAKYFHRMKLENVNSIYTILTSLIIILLPMGLVIVQPDLGTSLLIAVSGIAVLWFAGMNHRYFIYTMLGFVISLPFIIAFLKPYQKLRVLTFLNPDRDPLGAGYQIIQSKIAVGSGGLFGKGFLKGTQSYLEFLPEKHTDFIFTLFSEDWFCRFGNTSIDFFNHHLSNCCNRSTPEVILEKFSATVWSCNFCLHNNQYEHGSWLATYSWFSITNYVLWWFFYVSNNDWIWYSNEC